MERSSSHSPFSSSACSPFFFLRRRVRRVSPVTQCPALFTEKSVVEAESVTRSEFVLDEVSEPQTESLAYGEVVPSPSIPVDMSTPASEVDVAGRVPKIKLPMLRVLLEVAVGKKSSLPSPTLPRPVVRLPAVTEGPTKTFP